MNGELESGGLHSGFEHIRQADIYLHAWCLAECVGSHHNELLFVFQPGINSNHRFVNRKDPVEVYVAYVIPTGYSSRGLDIYLGIW